MEEDWKGREALEIKQLENTYLAAESQDDINFKEV